MNYSIVRLMDYFHKSDAVSKCCRSRSLAVKDSDVITCNALGKLCKRLSIMQVILDAVGPGA